MFLVRGLFLGRIYKFKLILVENVFVDHKNAVFLFDFLVLHGAVMLILESWNLVLKGQALAVFLSIAYCVFELNCVFELKFYLGREINFFPHSINFPMK